MKYQYTIGTNPDFMDLCIELENELQNQDTKNFNYINHIPLNAIYKIHDVILIYHKGIPIGCGSFRPYNKKTAEVKHIYIKPRYRRMGYMSELMYQLEILAKRSGYSYLYVQNNHLFEDSFSFFHSLGFKQVDMKFSNNPSNLVRGLLKVITK